MKNGVVISDAGPIFSLATVEKLNQQQKILLTKTSKPNPL